MDWDEVQEHYEETGDTWYDVYVGTEYVGYVVCKWEDYALKIHKFKPDIDFADGIIEMLYDAKFERY